MPFTVSLAVRFVTQFVMRFAAPFAVWFVTQLVMRFAVPFAVWFAMWFDAVYRIACRVVWYKHAYSLAVQPVVPAST